MKILAVDTSTKTCSVALIDNLSLLAELVLISTRTHSKHLMKIINEVVDLSHCRISDIDAFAVTKGPGTFTGLRIGISTIKGLACALDKPVLGISTLEVLAMQLTSQTLICSMLDARRGEVYSALYRYVTSDGEKKRLSREKFCETVLPIDQAIAGISEECTFIGDGAVVYKKEIVDTLGDLAIFAPRCLNVIFASTVAYAGAEKSQGNDLDSIEMLMPHYVRKPDAKLPKKNNT